jgi:hypothetical protein
MRTEFGIFSNSAGFSIFMFSSCMYLVELHFAEYHATTNISWKVPSICSCKMPHNMMHSIIPPGEPGGGDDR